MDLNEWYGVHEKAATRETAVGFPPSQEAQLYDKKK
jgi:hypothetical protein